MANEIGKWAFVIAAVISIITGIGAGLNQAWASNAWITAVLVVLGLTVGFVNITAREVQGFLIASVAVLLANGAGLASLFPGMIQFGAILAGIVVKIVITIAPAALIVALRSVYGFAAE